MLYRWTIGLETAAHRLGARSLTLTLSLLTYHGVEKLARKWRPKRLWKVFAAVAVALAISFPVAISISPHIYLFLSFICR